MRWEKWMYGRGGEGRGGEGRVCVEEAGEGEDEV